MTVTVTSIVAGPYFLTGGVDVLDFNFLVFTPAEVEVVVIDTDNNETIVSPSAYTVQINTNLSGSAIEGGSVTYSGPAGARVELRADPSFTQGQVFTQNGFRPPTINEAADRACLRDLRLAYDTTRTVGGKGDPGGNVMAVGLKTGVSGLNVPVGADLIQTSGYSQKRLGMARYGVIAEDDAAAAALGLAQNSYTVRSANGRWFRNTEVFPDVTMFGAVGDNITDDTVAIQACVDFALYVTRRGGVFVPGTKAGYKITNTIQIGYGVSYNGAAVYTSCDFYGEKASGIDGVFGSSLRVTFSDRPAIAVTAGRQTRIRSLAIFGTGKAYMQSQGLLYPAGQVANYGVNPGNALADNPATWADPAWAVTALSRYAPYAAIAVDPYVGSAPGTPYPNVSFPAFLGTPAQYGKAASSDTIIDSVFIEGFATGIVFSPSGASAQDDFARVNHCWLQFCVYGISVSHTDARLMNFSDNYLSSMHTALVGDVHGQQLGQFGSVISNTGMDRCVNWFSFGDVGNERTGVVTFDQCYGENAWRLGRYGATGGGVLGQNGLRLSGCKQIYAHGGALGSPANIIDLGLFTRLQVTGGQYQNMDRGGFVIRGRAGSIAMDEVSFSLLAAVTNPYEKYAKTAAPVVITDILNGVPIRFSGAWPAYDAQTGASAVRASGLTARCSKNLPAPIYAPHISSNRSFFRFGNQKRIANPCAGQSFAKAGVTSSLVDLDLTVTFGARSEALFGIAGPLPGDVLVDAATGLVFYVYNRTGLVVKAKLQNGYRVAAGVYTYPAPYVPGTADPLICYNSRIFCPNSYLKGDLTSGSATIANVSGDDSGQNTVAADIPVGSFIYTDPTEDNICGIGGSEPLIAAVDGTAKSITLTGVAAKTDVRRTLGLFALAGVPNV